MRIEEYRLFSMFRFSDRVAQVLFRSLLVVAIVVMILLNVLVIRSYIRIHSVDDILYHSTLRTQNKSLSTAKTKSNPLPVPGLNPLQADEDIACHVPKLNPFDPSIIKFVHHPRGLVCKQIQPNMTFVDENGYLTLNESGCADYSKSTNIFNYVCTYQTFDRAAGVHDNEMEYNEEMILTKPIKFSEDFVLVTCKHDNNTFYLNLHTYPALKPNRIFAKPIDDQLSVLLLYIDSISHSVLQRNLPATYNYTSNVMKMVFFEGLNKIGDNSFPNMMAAMTGKRAYDEQEGMMKELKERYNRRFDPWPFIWKMFAAKGYATTFNEDKAEWGMFHYNGDKGFVKKPFEYYYHIYWRAIYERHIKNSSASCFGNEPKPRIFLDIARRHQKMTNTTLQFMYNFYTDQSHDYVNEVERMDNDLLAFWRDMFENGHLNSTVVIFASDHGHRFSAVRSTILGLLEERLPFLGLWFPEWFYKKYPHILRNMRYNAKLLASTFDIHETLKDILDINYDGEQRPLHSRGLSLLYLLPKNRTCVNAGIPDHYCTCIRESEVNATLPLFKKGAADFVLHLNGLISNHTTICSTISLKNVLYVREIDFDEKVKKGVKNYGDARIIEGELRNVSPINNPSYAKNMAILKSYRFGIETEPFGAQFEAVLKMDNSTVWQVMGAVSRINSYQGKSDCVDDGNLRKYCSCTNVTISSQNNVSN